jgi:hypothetical protein
MVVERMNKLSIMVERVALLCILAVRCTAWIYFVSLLSGATSSSIIRGGSQTECLLEELDDGAFDDRVFLVKKLVAIFHIVVALTHNGCTGGCLPVGKHTREVYGVMEVMVKSLYYYCRMVVSEVHKLGWILAHRVCRFLNMQPPIKMKLKLLY